MTNNIKDNWYLGVDKNINGNNHNHMKYQYKSIKKLTK